MVSCPRILIPIKIKDVPSSVAVEVLVNLAGVKLLLTLARGVGTTISGGGFFCLTNALVGYRNLAYETVCKPSSKIINKQN